MFRRFIFSLQDWTMDAVAATNMIAMRYKGPASGARYIAIGHGLSPRQAQRLFEQSSTTFTEFLLEQRLLQARAGCCSIR
jgi:hypothetical protein